MDETDVQQNLEKTLNLMESIKDDVEIKEFYSGVNSLIEQTGYKKIELKKPWNEYFAKQNEDGENLVLVRFIGPVEEKINHYGFAKVKPGKLEEFCERLNQYDKRQENSFEISSSIIGMGIGTILALLGKEIYCNIKGVESFLDPTMDPLADTMILGFLGMLFGATFIGYAYDSLKKRINAKKMMKCGSFLKFDEEALKLAFSQEN